LSKNGAAYLKDSSETDISYYYISNLEEQTCGAFTKSLVELLLSSIVQLSPGKEQISFPQL